MRTITTRFGEKYSPTINLRTIRLARETGIALRTRVGTYIFDLPTRRWRIPIEVLAVREGAEPETVCIISLSSPSPPPIVMSVIHLLVTLWWPLSREGAPHPPPALDDDEPYREVRAAIIEGFNELVRRLNESGLIK